VPCLQARPESVCDRRSAGRLHQEQIQQDEDADDDRDEQEADHDEDGRNLVVPAGVPDEAAFEITATPTPLLARAIARLGLSPAGR
jgi:hypothetical protein